MVTKNDLTNYENKNNDDNDDYNNPHLYFSKKLAKFLFEMKRNAYCNIFPPVFLMNLICSTRELLRTVV